MHNVDDGAAAEAATTTTGAETAITFLNVAVEDAPALMDTPSLNADDAVTMPVSSIVFNSTTGLNGSAPGMTTPVATVGSESPASYAAGPYMKSVEFARRVVVVGSKHRQPGHVDGFSTSTKTLKIEFGETMPQ